MTTLTKKLKQTHSFIFDYFIKYGLAPTEREIAAGIGISSRGVAHRYVVKLEKLGMLRRIPDKRRNIVLSIGVMPGAMMLFFGMIALNNKQQQGD